MHVFAVLVTFFQTLSFTLSYFGGLIVSIIDGFMMDMAPLRCLKVNECNSKSTSRLIYF